MPTPSPDRYADEIAACERELDTLYPDWRQPPDVRHRRGGFSHLSPDDAEKVKRALKIRQLRLAGRSGDVMTVWVFRMSIRLRVEPGSSTQPPCSMPPPPIRR